MVFNINTGFVEASAATESGFGTEIAAAAAAAAAPLVAVMPMGADPDSIAFAAALNAAGAAYLGSVGAHAGSRATFAAAQSLAAATAAATEAARDTQLAI